MTWVITVNAGRIMKKTMFMFAAALLMVACSNEDVAVNDDVQYVSELKLNFGGSRVTETATTSGLSFAWDNGDIVKVYEKTATGTSYMQFKYDAASDKFVGNTPATDKMAVGTEYVVVYKLEKTGDNTFSGQLRQGSATPFKELPLISEVFEATSETAIASMHHIVGVLEIPVKAKNAGTTLDMIEANLYGSANKITGDFTVTGAPSYTITPSTGVNTYSNAYVTGLSKSLSTTTTTSVFIPVFPFGSESIQIDYTTNNKPNGTGFISATDERYNVVRGKITKLPEQTLE